MPCQDKLVRSMVKYVITPHVASFNADAQSYTAFYLFVNGVTVTGEHVYAYLHADRALLEFANKLLLGIKTGIIAMPEPSLRDVHSIRLHILTSVSAFLHSIFDGDTCAQTSIVTMDQIQTLGITWWL